jgi:hypothetical protein
MRARAFTPRGQISRHHNPRAASDESVGAFRMSICSIHRPTSGVQEMEKRRLLFDALARIDEVVGALPSALSLVRGGYFGATT